MPPGNWERIATDHFNVYFEPQDQKAAEDLLDWYSSIVPEFAENLELKVPSNVTVFIAPNQSRFRYLTKGLPEWIGGAVYPKQRLVLLLTPRKQESPAQFKMTALHEAVHLLTELDGDSHLPKWLSEGLAVYLSGETLFKNRTALARAVVLNKTYTLDEIDEVITRGPEGARVSYLQAISMVDYLVENYGWRLIAQLVEEYRDGKNPDRVFISETGKPFLDIEIAWHQHLKRKYRWWNIVEWFDFDSVLWGSATLLVLIVGSVTLIRRYRYIHSNDDEFHEGGAEQYWSEDNTYGGYYEYEDED